ncbi:putative arabinosyltransferase ARAD1 [Vitis vinifera]|uniref:Putative arabinosyltransferase ARAD1 n=1 Tax=Vitis vinifera TaxID=29760 RepID=A0A438HBX3_VITVI|nr:putative arabinosyltransferase ARAD1 [Vitis vinifera]
MAGKYVASSSLPNPRGGSTRSPILLLTFSLLSLSLLLFLFSILPSHPNPNPNRNPNLNTLLPESSFVASLEHFLISKSPRSPPIRDDTVGSDDPEAVKKLDDLVWQREIRRVYEDPYYPAASGLTSAIRVYVYEMPAKFTYDLLWLFRNTYKETSNRTSNGSPVHRLIEQHSIDYWLWADLIAPESERLLKNVVRVHRQEEADLFYIPFFTTISFFLLEPEQWKPLYRVGPSLMCFMLRTSLMHSLFDRNERLITYGETLKWVTDQPAWKRSGGRDHILPVHHPWSFKTVRKSMKNAIWLLPDMDSTGNWYKPGQVSLEKDLILPYVPNVDLCDAKCSSESESKRKTLLFFRGRLKRNAGGKIRAKLMAELSGADGVVIEEGTAGEGGKEAAQRGMRKSIFCLSPAGDTPSSARLFDAIVSGCIPVIVSDELELPFEGILDYRKIALFVSSSDAMQPGWLLTFLKSISPAQIKEMQRNLVKMAGKLINIKLHTRRLQRVVRESRKLCTCDCKRANFTGP